MTFGDDSRTANLHPDSEAMAGDSFSFRLIPLVKSASLRGKVIQLNLMRLSDGEHEYIQMREVPPDGRIAGGWPVDEVEQLERGRKEFEHDTADGCLKLTAIVMFCSAIVLCWVLIFFILGLR